MCQGNFQFLGWKTAAEARTDRKEWAIEFHRLRVWSILALGSRDLRLNSAGFRVLRYVAGCGFGHFLSSGFKYFTQRFLFCRVFEVVQSM